MPTIGRRHFLAGSAAMLAAGCRPKSASPPTPELPARPNIIVFLSDTLRARHLSCYGYPLATTPRIDEAAANAIVFEECYAAATWTLPATASLLTGMHPLIHRTVVPEWSEEGTARGFQHHVLPMAIPTTASTLEAAGYSTGFFQANPNASGRRGLARGCQHRWSKVDAKPEVHLDAVLDWLENEAREPFYAYIHLIDPHEPYAADPELFRALHGRSMEDYLRELPDDERTKLTDYHLRDWQTLFELGDRLDTEALRTFSAPSIAYLKKLYDSEIRRVDTAFGRLQDWLAGRDLGQRTATVLTSDHGEAFGEDQFFYHGSCLHDPQLHVPLIIALPGARGETRVPWSVGQCDIHASLLTLAGQPITQPSVGESLLLSTGAVVPTSHRSVLSSLDLHSANLESWDFRLTRGPYRVYGHPGKDTVTLAERGREPEAREVSLYDINRIESELAKRAVTDYHETQQSLRENATRFPLPTWRQVEQFDEETFRAMGYL